MISRDKLEQMASILGGVPIWGCLEGSPSARAGMQYGDILMEVNGERVKSIREYAIARSLDEDEMVVKIVRNGREQVLRLDLTRRSALGETQLRALGKELANSRILSLTSAPEST